MSTTPGLQVLLDAFNSLGSSNGEPSPMSPEQQRGYERGWRESEETYRRYLATGEWHEPEAEEGEQ